jgi:Zn-dependent protease with chaperone function
VTAGAVSGLLAIVLFAAVAPVLSRRLAPAIATRLLVPASVVAAGSGVFILAVVAFTWVGQFPLVAAHGSWSPTLLRRDSPVPAEPAILSCGLVAVAMISVTVATARRAWALFDVHRACRGLTAAGRLVVLDDARPDAFTTPQPAGRIIVTTGLLRTLDQQERRVLLAHETSHLAHQHAWWTLASDLAAAVNPLLRPTARALATTVERWADEDAAGAVGDRRLVAATLVRVAHLQSGFADEWRPDAARSAATGGDVAIRVHALLAPAPRRRPFAVTVLAVLLLVGLLPTAAVQHTGEGLFEQAALVPRVHHA